MRMWEVVALLKWEWEAREVLQPTWESCEAMRVVVRWRRGVGRVPRVESR